MELKPMTLEEATRAFRGVVDWDGDFQDKDMEDILRSYALHIVETARPEYRIPNYTEDNEDAWFNNGVEDYHSAAVALIEKDL